MAAIPVAAPVQAEPSVTPAPGKAPAVEVDESERLLHLRGRRDYPTPFLDFARWIFLATLAFAPWAFGSAHPDQARMVARLLLSATLLWGIGHAHLRRWPRAPLIPSLLLFLLVCQSWWMALNARAVLDPQFGRFIPIEPLFSALPGSVNRAASWPKALLYTGLAGAFGIVCDLVQERRWRTRLMITIGLTGTSIILYGMVLRLMSVRKILWISELPGHTWPFATYLYHGNAGAFINMVVPIVTALAVASFLKNGQHLQRAGWLSAMAICIAAIVVNASKAAMVIGALELVLLAGWAYRVLASRELEVSPRAIAIYAVAILGAFVGVAWSVGWDMSLERWSEFGVQLNGGNLRLLAHQAAFQAGKDAGYFGFGPGTFAGVFPYYTHSFGNALAGTWLSAHQDYLQTWIEWGKTGAAVWGLFLVGAIASAGWTLIIGTRRQISPSALALCWTSLVALLGVSLHALVDFPLQIASLQLYFTVFTAVCWSSPLWSQIPKSAKSFARSKAATLDRSGEPVRS